MGTDIWKHDRVDSDGSYTDAFIVAYDYDTKAKQSLLIVQHSGKITKAYTGYEAKMIYEKLGGKNATK